MSIHCLHQNGIVQRHVFWRVGGDVDTVCDRNKGQMLHQFLSFSGHDIVIRMLLLSKHMKMS